MIVAESAHDCATHTCDCAMHRDVRTNLVFKSTVKWSEKEKERMNENRSEQE